MTPEEEEAHRRAEATALKRAGTAHAVASVPPKEGVRLGPLLSRVDEVKKHPADWHPDMHISHLTEMNQGIEVKPITLPENDGKTRTLRAHDGRPYRLLAAKEQRDHIENQIQRLETEHFGLTRGFSTVSHSGQLLEGETVDQSVRRVYDKRRTHVEAELDRLYAEYDLAHGLHQAEVDHLKENPDAS
jgi:hypothetical protein